MESKPTQRGPYAKTPRVRATIVAAATDVFSEVGFRATTMKEVAARAGISQRGLVHHFPTKDDLLLEVIRAREAEAGQWVERTADLDFFGSILAVAKDNAAHPGQVELHTLMSAEAISTEHPAHDHYRLRYEGYEEFVVGALAKLRDKGRLRTDLEPRLLAQMFIAVSDGIQIQWLYNRDAVDTERVLAGFVDLITEHPDPDSRPA